MYAKAKRAHLTGHGWTKKEIRKEAAKASFTEEHKRARRVTRMNKAVAFSLSEWVGRTTHQPRTFLYPEYQRGTLRRLRKWWCGRCGAVMRNDRHNIKTRQQCRKWERSELRHQMAGLTKSRRQCDRRVDRLRAHPTLHYAEGATDLLVGAINALEERRDVLNGQEMRLSDSRNDE